MPVNLCKLQIINPVMASWRSGSWGWPGRNQGITILSLEVVRTRSKVCNNSVRFDFEPFPLDLTELYGTIGGGGLVITC